MTRSYIVLIHGPLVFEPNAMIEHDSLPFVFDKHKPLSVGLLRRDQPSTPGQVRDVWNMFSSYEE